jgi:dTDP-4-dehydrorhamnose 3,5-epimerase
MRLEPLEIEGAWIAESTVWTDDRGSFREWFKASDVVNATGIYFSVEQANLSHSNQGVIRGIHYSLAPMGQSKWVTCIQGSILDVIIDIRPNSPTYRKYQILKLTSNEGRAVLIGNGLGHGFIALEENTLVSYLLSSPYAPEFEFEIHPTDSELNIDWQLELIGGRGTIISTKDANAPTLAERLAQGKLPK